MPSNTIHVYNDQAKAFSDKYDTKTPTHTYELAEQFFHKGKSTLDVGCGTGRDTEYLSAHGFPTSGMDASTGMIAEAKKRRPSCTFVEDSLPLLSSQRSNSIHNIFCSALLSHLSEAMLPKAAINMLRVLHPKGIALFSFRGPSTPAADSGRLFMRYTPEHVGEIFAKFHGTVILAETVKKDKDATWHYLVVGKA